jgi:penicillin amidase
MDEAQGRSRRRRRLVLRAFAALVALVLVAGGGGAFWFRSQLRGSLPLLEGERDLAGLASPVRIERDALGVPRIVGANRLDLARATGFLHAQDRFFQMDLLRRGAAGELAEIFGGPLVKNDREARVHRFRTRARRVIESASPDERALVEAYAEGVNAGLGALASPPFEYVLLRVRAEEWRAEDSVLAALAMFLRLQGGQARRESDRGLLADVLPPEIVAFLLPPGTEWDAPLEGGPLPQPPVPGPEVLDLRGRPATPRAAAGGRPHGAWEEPIALGSNNWAVAGAHTAHGGSLLADDMHLGLGVPNTWYRVSLEWSEGGAPRRVTGATLPGTPAVVVGSNTHVAWGFTNTEGDWSDLVVVEPDPHDADAYLAPGGSRKLERVTETIRVKDEPDQALEVVSTSWGPIVDKDHHGRLRALRWVAHEPEAVNLGLFRLESAETLEQALEAANRSGAPAQNFVCADDRGRIAWTVLGRIPRRVGFDGRRPGSWADGRRRWEGWLAPAEYPRVVDPPSGRIWTANARVVGGEALATMGESFYDLGARARQIRDGLLALERASERDMLAVQLDDRALFLARWRDLLLAVLKPEAVAQSPLRRECRERVEQWGGRAAVDSVGYRIVRAFRARVAEEALLELTAPARAADERFDPSRLPRTEGPLWALVSERPAHLLNPRHATWDSLLLAALDAALEDLTRDGAALARQTWGARNTALIQHPLSRALPSLGRWLDMPREPLPGDSNMPRVQAPGSGASQRMAVSPGRETEGYFHMPGGQSGHPLSPFYRAGHEAWAKGEATPFLPGPARHVLTLRPPNPPPTRGVHP